MTDFPAKAKRRQHRLARAIVDEIEPETSMLENAIMEEIAADVQLRKLLSAITWTLDVRRDRDHGDDVCMTVGAAAAGLEDAARYRAHEVAAETVRSVASDAPELRRQGADLDPGAIRDEATLLLDQIEEDPEVLRA